MVADQRERERVFLLLAVVVLFSFFHYLHDLAKIQGESSFIDFAHYYTYTKAVAVGVDPFDPQALAPVESALHIRRAGAPANYPPLFYLLMRPWVALPFGVAASVWFFASQVCLLAALALCFRPFASASPVRVATLLFVVLNYQPVMESMALGQSNLLLLFLMALAWWGLRTGSPWVTAGAIATAIHIKPQYGILLLLLWWAGYRRAGARAAFLAIMGLVTGLIVVGPAQHLSYLRYVFSLPEHLLIWTANISPRATIHRLFEGLSQGATVADALWLVFCAAILVVIAQAIPRTPPPGFSAIDWTWGIGLTAVLLLSPLTEEHHLVVLLLPVAFLLLHEPEAPICPLEIGVLVGSLILLGSRYSLERFPAFHQGVLSLLAAGKLLGIFGLACVLVSRLRLSVDQRTA